jgi:hypothetical protein
LAAVAAANGRLLGRRAEIAAVDDALEELERRRGTVIAFSGEGGIGKTRLLDELGTRADARGHLVLYGRASELERELPFGVWEDALAEHAEFLGVDRLERLVGEQLRSTTSSGPTTRRWSWSRTCCGGRPAGGSRWRSRSGPRPCARCSPRRWRPRSVTAR